MSNPPITIGPFDNVPAPQSPMSSAWAQELTQYVVDLAAAPPDPNNLQMITGTYTPVLTNMVVGVGGTNTARYTWIGPVGAGGNRGIIFVSGLIVFGSSGQTFPGAGNEAIAMPGPAVNFFLDKDPTYLQTPIGHAIFNNAGSVNVTGRVWYYSETGVRLVTCSVSGTNVVDGDITATVPFTWAAGYIIRYSFTCGAIVQ